MLSVFKFDDYRIHFVLKKFSKLKYLLLYSIDTLFVTKPHFEEGLIK
jgi:hypothetical protein